jgi:hypothetical protein
MPDIFVHISKTGGTTLSTTLRWLYGPSACYQIPTGRAERPSQWFDEVSSSKLENVDLVMGHATYGAHVQIPGPCRYFTMLRHPIRRVVSLFYHIKTAWPNSEVASMSLVEFLDSNHRAARPNDQVRFVSGLAPEDDPSEALQRARQNLKEKFTAFGLTERFDESLLLFRHRLGWSRPPVYVSSNVNSKRPTVEDLPTSVIDSVRAKNELDLELYRFAAELFQSTLRSEYPDIEQDRERLEQMNRITDIVGPPALWTYRTVRSFLRGIAP